MTVTQRIHFHNKAAGIVCLVLGAGLLVLLILGLVKQDGRMLWVSAGGLALILLIYALLFRTTLQVRYSPNAIAYSFFPFTLSERTVRLAEVLSMRVTSVNPIGEFGGYGYRIKPKTTAYILGSEALRIELRNGHVLYLTVSDAAEIERYVKETFSN